MTVTVGLASAATGAASGVASGPIGTVAGAVGSAATGAAGALVTGASTVGTATLATTATAGIVAFIAGMTAFMSKYYQLFTEWVTDVWFIDLDQIQITRQDPLFQPTIRLSIENKLETATWLYLLTHALIVVVDIYNINGEDRAGTTTNYKSSSSSAVLTIPNSYFKARSIPQTLARFQFITETYHPFDIVMYANDKANLVDKINRIQKGDWNEIRLPRSTVDNGIKPAIFINQDAVTTRPEAELDRDHITWKMITRL